MWFGCILTNYVSVTVYVPLFSPNFKEYASAKSLPVHVCVCVCVCVGVWCVYAFFSQNSVSYIIKG